jgi:hypothetical protein
VCKQYIIIVIIATSPISSPRGLVVIITEQSYPINTNNVVAAHVSYESKAMRLMISSTTSSILGPTILGP